MGALAPPIISAQSAADVQQVLRDHSRTAAAFAPSHIIDVGPTGAVDLLGSWHLASEGGDATLYPTDWGVRHRGMHTAYASVTTWKASDAGHFNFSTGSWALMFVTAFHKSPPDLPRSSGGGGYWLGNMKGPTALDPFNGDGLNTYGADRGYGLSANGDGGMGFQISGTTGYLNVDIVGHDFTDGKMRVHVFGYNATLGFGFLSGAEYDLVIDPDNPGVFIHQSDPGDITSPDGIFALRCEYPYLSCHATQETARLMVFEGANAESLYTHRATYLPTLQGSLMATTTSKAIRDVMIAAVRGIAPAVMSGDRFRHYREDGGTFLEHCEGAPDCLRLFSIRLTAGSEAALISMGDVEQVEVEFQLVVAYPRRMQPGDLDHPAELGLDDLIESDKTQLINTIGTPGYQRLDVSAGGDATVTHGRWSIDEGEACRFLVLPLSALYYCAMT